MATIVQPLFNDEEIEALIRILEYLEDEENDYAERSPEDRSTHIFRSVLALRASGLIIPQAFESLKSCFSPGAIEAFQRAGQQPWEFLTRHYAKDWGDVCAEDWKANGDSLENGLRLFSSYCTKAGDRLWVITEADRSMTTISLPEEY